MKVRDNGKGYLCLKLKKEGKYTHKYVHILVAEAFKDNPDRLPTVNHKDGNKKNNTASNLEWASYSTNNQHAIDEGLRVPTSGEDHCTAKLTDADVIEIRRLYRDEKVLQKELAVRYAVNPSTISALVNNKYRSDIKAEMVA